jgi:hypothetical protein
VAPHWSAVANSTAPKPPTKNRTIPAINIPTVKNRARRFIGKTAGQVLILIGNSTLRRLFRATDSQKL